jgi:hypothetical protein
MSHEYDHDDINTFTGLRRKGKDLLLSAIMVVDTLDERDEDPGAKATVEPRRHAEIIANLSKFRKGVG